MEECFPDEGSDAAREGDAAHWVAQKRIHLHGNRGDFVGKQAPNGVVITDEMVDHTDEYVKSVCHTATDIAYRHVEEPVQIPAIHRTDCWGTPDCWYYCGQTNTLHVWDYKYGWGIVEPDENKQMVCYAAGAINVLFPNGADERCQTLNIVFHLLQPRPSHVAGTHRIWKTTAGELRGHVNQLEAAAAEALSDNPRCITGPGCKYCRARHACDACIKAGYNAIDVTGQPLLQSLQPAALGKEYRTMLQALELVKCRVTGLEAQIMNLPDPTPTGFAVQHGTGRQQWSRPNAEVFALGDMMGVELRAPESPCTPAQAIKKGLEKSLVQSFTTTPSTGKKLVPASQTLAARAFNA